MLAGEVLLSMLCQGSVVKVLQFLATSAARGRSVGRFIGLLH